MHRDDVHLPAQRDGHDDLLEGGVACPLADAVDGALNLACPVHGAGQAVGGRQPQVILAVGGDDDVVDAGRVGLDVGDQAAKLVRQVPAGGVRDVEGGRTGLWQDVGACPSVWSSVMMRAAP